MVFQNFIIFTYITFRTSVVPLLSVSLGVLIFNNLFIFWKPFHVPYIEKSWFNYMRTANNYHLYLKPSKNERKGLNLIILEKQYCYKMSPAFQENV